MYVQRIGVLFFLVVVAGCEQKRGACHNETCTTEQRCDETTYHCVDDLRPVLSLTPLTEVITAATFTVTGFVKDDLLLTNAEWRAGDRAWTTIDGVDVDGGFVLTIDAPLVDAELVVVSARANDVHGEVTAHTEVKVDRVGPSLLLKVPAENSVQGADSFQVDVIAHDGSGSIASFSLHGAPVANPVNDGRVSTTVTVPANANHLAIPVLATATDARGNATTKTFTFFGDRVAPEVTFTSPALNQFITTATFTVEVVVVEPGALQGVVFHVGTTDVPGVMGANGHWTASLPAGEVEQDAIITVTATDDAGNVGSASRTVRIDRVVPTISITAPTASGLFRAAVPVSVQTSPGTATVSATLEGQTTMLTGGPTTWTGSLAVLSHDYAPLAVQVRALDLAGNEGTATVTIGVDTIAPVITFTAPGSMQKFNALDFSATPEVTSTWTVVDGDAQAATTTVNGAASTALSFARATVATDNPTTYTTTVTAADRAGNSTTASRSYLVDRVAPSITTWTPAANARNVDPRVSVVTFSERVDVGANATSPALTISGLANPAASAWDAAHTTYTLDLDTLPYRVLDLGVSAGLQDGFGNLLVVPASRRVHTATGYKTSITVPIGPATGLVATEAIASSDPDGIATILVRTSSNTTPMRIFKDTGGTFTEITTTLLPERWSVNSWNVVNPTTLASDHRFAVSSFNSNGGTWSTQAFLNGVVENSTVPETTSKTFVTSPASFCEGTTTPVAWVAGSAYTRGTSLLTLPWSPTAVSPSRNGWIGYDAYSSAASLRWVHFNCAQVVVLGRTSWLSSSAGFESSSAGWDVSGALTPNGDCHGVAWTTSASRYIAFQAMGDCTTGSTAPHCLGTFPAVATAPTEARLAPFAGNGANSMLMTFKNSAGAYVLAQMLPGVCTMSNATTLLTSAPAQPYRSHMPVQIGNRPAMLVVTLLGETKLLVP